MAAAAARPVYWSLAYDTNVNLARTPLLSSSFGDKQSALPDVFRYFTDGAFLINGVGDYSCIDKKTLTVRLPGFAASSTFDSIVSAGMRDYFLWMRVGLVCGPGKERSQNFKPYMIEDELLCESYPLAFDPLTKTFALDPADEYISLRTFHGRPQVDVVTKIFGATQDMRFWVQILEAENKADANDVKFFDRKHVHFMCSFVVPYSAVKEKPNSQRKKPDANSSKTPKKKSKKASSPSNEECVKMIDEIIDVEQERLERAKKDCNEAVAEAIVTSGVVNEAVCPPTPAASISSA